MSGTNRVKGFESVPMSNNAIPMFGDGGQGAAGRLASWQAWTADGYPQIAPQTTVLWRDETYEPMLDGISQGAHGGAISGGDNAFLLATPVQQDLTDEFGVVFTFDTGTPILGNV